MANKFDHQRIDSFLHSRIRLAIMAVLATVDEIDFVSLKESVNTTDGNLSIHLKKLAEAGYLEIQKQFVKNKPMTTCSITEDGTRAMNDYISTVEKFIKNPIESTEQHEEANDEEKL